MRKILLSPHNDDAVLFCGFAICEHPDIEVVTVFDSCVQPKNPRLTDDEKQLVSVAARRLEDCRAVGTLHAGASVQFAGLRDDQTYTEVEIRAAVDIAAGKPCWTDVELWLPMHHQDGHLQHNAVANAFAGWIPSHHYTTYSRNTGRVRQEGAPVVLPNPEWITRKLRALACYQSQIEIKALGCWPWFMDLQEYVA